MEKRRRSAMVLALLGAGLGSWVEPSQAAGQTLQLRLGGEEQGGDALRVSLRASSRKRAKGGAIEGRWTLRFGRGDAEELVSLAAPLGQLHAEGVAFEHHYVIAEADKVGHGLQVRLDRDLGPPLDEATARARALELLRDAGVPRGRIASRAEQGLLVLAVYVHPTPASSEQPALRARLSLYTGRLVSVERPLALAYSTGGPAPLARVRLSPGGHGSARDGMSIDVVLEGHATPSQGGPAAGWWKLTVSKGGKSRSITSEGLAPAAELLAFGRTISVSPQGDRIEARIYPAREPAIASEMAALQRLDELAPQLGMAPTTANLHRSGGSFRFEAATTSRVLYRGALGELTGQLLELQIVDQLRTPVAPTPAPLR